MDLIIAVWYIYIQQEHVVCKGKKRNQKKFFYKSRVTVPHYLRTGRFWCITCPWYFWPFSTTAASKHQDLVCCSAAYYAAWHTLHATYLNTSADNEYDSHGFQEAEEESWDLGSDL